MSVSAINNNLVSDLGIREKQQANAAPKSNELGQDAFLQLMITQMENQNPLSPQDNGEFVAQLAQFSSVEGLEKLNGSVSSMATSFRSSQALEATSMVGRTVKIDGEESEFTMGSRVMGTIDLPFSSQQVTMNIYDEANNLVSHTVDSDSNSAGPIPFSWDGFVGTDEAGNAKYADSGRYRFEVLALNPGTGRPEQVETSLSANVDSVTVASNGNITLNVAGVGPTSMAAVKEIL